VIYPRNFEEKIGFDRIREMLSDLCVSEMGREHTRKMRFMWAYDALKQRLGQTEEFRQILLFGKTFPAQNYFNLIPELKRIQMPGTHLLQENLFDLKTSLQALFDTISYLKGLEKEKFPLLLELLRDLDVEKAIVKEIERLMDDRGNIRDNASEELAAIRRQMKKLAGEVDRSIRKIMEQARKSGYVNPGDDITIRNGRLVIPVPVTYKRKIRGFVQDESSSGQTVFIEPAESLEANNEIRELENAEKREINKILAAFTDFLRPYAPALIEAYNFLGLVDFIRAKASLAIKLEAGLPILNDKPVVEWWDARHPLLFLAHQKQKKEIIPLEIKLVDDKRILVISGPNAGGKSVCLKTVGLLQYMLQCGLLVPMRETSETGIFRDIFIDIGDEQSIENDLSTYTSHLRNMKNFALKAGKNSLFLVDEMGTGTEPRMGGAIAESVLEHLNGKGCFGVVTTHYSNLKVLADKTPGMVNGAMLFDTRQMQPLFRLQIGNPGSSFAFEMAKKTGFPWYILRNAEKKVGKTEVKFDKQLQQLEVEKKEVSERQKALNAMEKKYRELTEKYESLKTELEANKAKILKEAKQEAKQIIEGSNKLIENTIREIREAQADKEKTRIIREKLKEKKNEADPQKTEEKKIATPKKKSKPKKEDEKIIIGNRVRIPPQTTVGEVVEISGKDAMVSFGSVIMKIPLSKLVNVGEEQYHEKMVIRKRSYRHIVNDLNDKMANFKLSLDLRGKRAEEASTDVQRYIDEALLLSVKEVKILHGKGNGILREVIRDQLRVIPEVKRFGDEKLEMGGSGITVVVLK
jgi:DNA mismatch repair protein MutS2